MKTVRRGMVGALVVCALGGAAATTSAEAQVTDPCPALFAERDTVVQEFAALIAQFPDQAAVFAAQRDAILAVINNNLAQADCFPKVSTQASPAVQIGGAVHDTATISGPGTGTIRFDLYGPDDANCSGPSVFTSTTPVGSDRTAQSAEFTPTALGTYRWVASYSGDSGNPPNTAPCNAPNESVEVTKANVTLSTQASPSVTVGGDIFDTATVSGGPTPLGGSATFSIYGPDDPTCQHTALRTSMVPVEGGQATSPPYTTSSAGSYHFAVTYSGDTLHQDAASPCTAPNETVTVTTAHPTLTTQSSGAVTLGGSVSDSAMLAGGFQPTGLVTFTLWGPDNPSCTGTPVVSSTVPLSGATAQSAPFSPTSPGVYRWVASYSGDPNNDGVTAACNAPNESVTVNRIATRLSVDPVLVGRGTSGGLKVTVGTVSARLTSGSPAVGVPGQLITFRVPSGPVLCTAITNSTGRATCQFALTSLVSIVLSTGVEADFAGTASLAPASGRGGLVKLS